MYQVTKTYGHELGLSACFRQWRAQSHCRFLHGYPLSFTLVFQAAHLNEQNWVIDFGGLKTIREWLKDTFDHKLVLASDDPQLHRLMDLGRDWEKDGLEKVADVLVLPAVGCEAFAFEVFKYVKQWLVDNNHSPRVQLVSVECREHGGNSAIYKMMEGNLG